MAPLVTPHARARICSRSSWVLPTCCRRIATGAPTCRSGFHEPVTVARPRRRRTKAQVRWLAKAAGIPQADRRAGRRVLHALPEAPP